MSLQLSHPKFISIGKILLFLFLFSLFSPIRHVFFTKTAYITGSYSDFTSFSLYLSDIALLFLIILFYRRIKLYYNILLPICLTFWLIIQIFILNKPNFNLTTWNILKLIEFIVAYGTFIAIFRENQLKTLFLRIFCWFGAGESLISLAQFLKNSSIGFKFFGESILGPNIPGVAKLVVEGERHIRGYGTFPHPNVLSAFLVTSTVLLVFYYIHSVSRQTKLINGILLVINLLGLTLTFSRAAYLAFVIGILVLFTGLLFKRYKIKQILPVVFILLSSFIAFAAVFKPFLVSRATISDQAVLERGFYNHIGWKMITSNPIIGIGAGQSIISTQKFSPITLEPWQFQPIHNYFLLSAVEWGIVGFLLFIAWLVIHVKHLITGYLSINTEEIPQSTIIPLIAILTSFLVLMQFDHYFFTLQQGQLLFWIIFAAIAANIPIYRVQRL